MTDKKNSEKYDLYLTCINFYSLCGKMLIEYQHYTTADIAHVVTDIPPVAADIVLAADINLSVNINYPFF